MLAGPRRAEPSCRCKSYQRGRYSSARSACDDAGMRAAVVGHVEWITFARVDAVPPVGGIAHATGTWEGPGGGGGVAAQQLAKLAGSCDFFTALGDDDLGRRSAEQLAEAGVQVLA